MEVNSGYVLQVAEDRDVPIVQEILENAKEYFLEVEASEVRPGFAEKEMRTRPSQVDIQYECLNLILNYFDQSIGFANLHLNHPKTKIVYFGLFLLRKEAQRQGHGRQFFYAIERKLGEEGFKSIKLGVSDASLVSDFWLKLGFKPNGFTYAWKGENRMNHVVEYEKPLLLGQKPPVVGPLKR